MRLLVAAVVAVTTFALTAGCLAGVSHGTFQTTGSTATAPTATPAPSFANGTTTNDTLSVYALNVGQGSSTLVVGPANETMLVDSGDWSDDGEHVVSRLQQLGIDRLDYLVTTHPDADHIGGHAAVIEYLETEGDGVGAVYDPGITSTSQTYRDYLDTIEAHNVTLYQTLAGDTIPFESLRVGVLAPPEGHIASEDANENSIVLYLAYGNTSFLLPGDGETASEAYLLEQYGARLNSTVLLVGHHGSNSSTGQSFLDAVNPRVAVVSSAYDSQYGHPHEAVLQRLSNHSVRTHWTATHGTILLQSNGTALSVRTQRASPTDALSFRDGNPVEPGSPVPLRDRITLQPGGSAMVPATADGPMTPTAVADGGSSSPVPGSPDQETLSVATVHANAAGNEDENLNDEYVVFENTGTAPIDLSGWTVSDEANHVYTVPGGVTLAPASQLTLHTGSGTDSATDLYWGSEAPVWNNAGDTIIVRNDEGGVVLEETYDG